MNAVTRLAGHCFLAVLAATAFVKYTSASPEETEKPLSHNPVPAEVQSLKEYLNHNPDIEQQLTLSLAYPCLNGSKPAVSSIKGL